MFNKAKIEALRQIDGKLILVLDPQEYRSGPDYLCDRTVSHGVGMKTGVSVVFPKNYFLKSLPAIYDHNRKQWILDLAELAKCLSK